MQRVDLNKPGEKKKLIAAGGLGLAALLVLYWVFIGFDSGTRTASRPQPSPSPQQRAGQTTQRPNSPTVSPDVLDAAKWAEINYEISPSNAPDAKRNIFAYYEPPVIAKPAPSTPTPTPTPTPPPPVLLASVSP